MSAAAPQPRSDLLQGACHRWRRAPLNREEVLALAREADLPPVIAALLSSRGAREAAEAHEFLRPSLQGLHPPETLPDIGRGVALIREALGRSDPICIYGDYDADGLTATALLVELLRGLGGDVSTYVPHRLREGYGLHCEAMRRIAASGARLLITVDGGANDHEELALTRQLGMKVIVTDHHAVTSLPPEVPVIHPGREDDPSPFPGLAGVGVAYKLAWALGKELAGAERVSPGHREFLLRALALVALGTVADVVPLLGENRVLVSYGLRAFQGLRHVGLEALIAECGLDAGSIASEQVAFRLAPHINAAGRLGRAEDALELLLTDDAHRARSLARALAAANRRRKEIEREMLSACVERLDAQDLGEPSLPIVIEGRGWHAGVAGIVAARLVDRYQRPVFVIAVEDGLGRGSARSPASRPLTPLYDGARRHAISIGGHERAGGLTVEEGCIDELRSALEEAARASAGVSAGEEGPPVRRYDLDLAGDSIDLSLLSSIERLAPFGEGNPLPRFRVGGLSVDGSPRLVGRGEDHLAFRVRTGRRRLRAIHFNGARHARRLTREGPLTLIAELTLNRYRGSASVELRVLDYLES